jgi:hypothetical protein
MVQPLPKMQSNPLAAIQAFTQPRRNQLAGLASGLLSGNDWGQGLSAGFAQAAQGRQVDDAYAVSQREAAQRQEQLAKTISYLRTQPGGSTWADAVENGLADPKDAFKAWYEQSQGGGAAKPMEINGQLVDPSTGKVIGDYRDKSAPAGDAYTLGPGQVRYDAGGNVIAKGPEKTQGPMNATTQKELFEADESIQAGVNVSQALDRALELNQSAWDGPAADMGTQAGALFGDKNSVDTQELKNLVTSQALDQLKATFGSMPTEGERKILLEIQGSVGQSREVRKRIFERAKAAVEKRVQFNKEKAAGLRSGEYFQDGFTPGGGAGGGMDDVDAILKGYGI